MDQCRKSMRAAIDEATSAGHTCNESRAYFMAQLRGQWNYLTNPV